MNRRPNGRPGVMVALILLLGILVFAGTTSGQTREDVRSALEKTDALLGSAEDIIGERGPGRGPAGLEMARVLQGRAWDAFNRQMDRLALDLTERARQEIYRALNSIRPGEDNEGEVERQLERTDAMLQAVSDRALDGALGMARHRFGAAMNTQRRAWDLFHERQLRPALRLTLQARDMISGIPPHGDLSAPGGLSGLEAQIERLDAASHRVSDRLADTPHPDAQRHWEGARLALAEARRAMHAGEGRRSEQMLARVRGELEAAMRLLMRDGAPGEVEPLIAMARERWRLVGSQMTESEDSQMRLWHEQAARHLDNAQSALSGGNTQRALVQTRRAIELLDRISTNTPH